MLPRSADLVERWLPALRAHLAVAEPLRSLARIPEAHTSATAAMLAAEDLCARMRREARIASEATFASTAARADLLRKLTTRAEWHAQCGAALRDVLGMGFLCGYRGQFSVSCVCALLLEVLILLTKFCLLIYSFLCLLIQSRRRATVFEPFFGDQVAAAPRSLRYYLTMFGETARVRLDHSFARVDAALRAAEARLPTCWFTPYEARGDGATACVICLEAPSAAEQTIRLPCSHSFHSDCVKGWLHANTTCPVCRRALATSL